MVEIEIDEARLKELERAIVSHVLLSGTRAVKSTTRALEQDFESLFRAQIKGNAWRAWKSQSYPKAAVAAYDPVGEVFINGGQRSQGLGRYFTTAGTNRAKGGGYLAIPLGAARNTARGRHITPAQWERANGVKLRPVFRAGKAGLLMADGYVGKTGAFAKMSADRAKAKQRGGQQLTRKSVAVFVLIAEQAHANSVNLSPSIARAGAVLEQEFLKRAARV